MLILVYQTGWGTRAGIGDPTAATAAAAAASANPSDEKLQDAPRQAPYQGMAR